MFFVLWLIALLVVVLLLLRWALLTHTWLTEHWNYHVQLHKAVCALESVAYDGVDPNTAKANRLCTGGGTPDDYKQPPPPPVFG